MSALRFLTAGESHGRGLVGIIDGIPAGMRIGISDINAQLARRQMGFGRGERMRIECDSAQILSGVRHGRTLGSPISLLIENRDGENWGEAMRVEAGGDRNAGAVCVPRPGHADYVGMVKYGHSDARCVSERASARETAMRTGLGSVARKFLENFDIRLASRVVSIGLVADPSDADLVPLERLGRIADASPVRCLGRRAQERMIAAIEAARRAGDCLGGVVEIRVSGLPVGLGGYVQWDRRLDGELARVFMSLNAIKGFEIGMGFDASRRPGSRVHDELFWKKDKTRAARRTNRSGGLDGGMTTGEDLVIRAAMKPLASLAKPLRSIDMEKKRGALAPIERSDVCAVPAAAVIGESLAALVLAEAFLVKYGGDSMDEVKSHYRASQRA